MRCLTGDATTKDLRRTGHLEFHDLIVFLLLGESAEALPGKAALEEVYEHVCQRLNVVPPALLHPQVCIDTGVASSARETFVVAVRDVLLRLAVSVPSRQSEVDHIYEFGLGRANDEILRLDVTVKEAARMQVLDAVNQLFRHKDNREERELAAAIVEQVFEVWSQQFHDHHVIRTVCARPMDLRDSLALNNLDDLGLVEELRTLADLLLLSLV